MKRYWIAAALAVAFLAIAARFVANFQYTYAPATDGAYYPMQTAWWLIHGRLMYDDLPLLFWLDAGLAKVLMATGQPLNNAVMTATRVVDCLTEPWAALFVMALGYAWSSGKRAALTGCIAAALVAVLSPSVMITLSDFQKNSLGLVWMAAAIWACRQAMISPSLKRWARLVLILALSALTHIGAFAITVLIAGVAILKWRRRSFDGCCWPLFRYGDSFTTSNRDGPKHFWTPPSCGSKYLVEIPVRNRLSDDAFRRYKHVVTLRLTGRYLTPDMVPPFRPTPIGPSAQKLYAGEYVEFWEMPRPKSN
jgi:hypothetical protein